MPERGQQLNLRSVDYLCIADGPPHVGSWRGFLPVGPALSGGGVIDELEDVRGHHHPTRSDALHVRLKDRPCDDVHIATGKPGDMASDLG
jgi:hypothetical protein